MRGVRVFRVIRDFGREDFADVFGLFKSFAAEAFGSFVDLPRAVVAVFLEGFELEGDFAEGSEAPIVFVGVGTQELSGFGREKVLGEMDRCGLEADFGEFTGILLAKGLGEVVHAQAGLEGVFLDETPIVVAAACFPVGDIATGDGVAEFLEGADNLCRRHVIEEHAVDHVAMDFGEASDLAVAGAFFEERARWREYGLGRERFRPRLRGSGEFEGGFCAGALQADDRCSGSRIAGG